MSSMNKREQKFNQDLERQIRDMILPRIYKLYHPTDSLKQYVNSHSGKALDDYHKKLQQIEYKHYKRTKACFSFLAIFSLILTLILVLASCLILNLNPSYIAITIIISILIIFIYNYVIASYICPQVERAKKQYEKTLKY